MTSEEVYYERGINLLHGFLTEYYVDDAEFIVEMPVGLKHLHVLVEPMSCAAKAVQQAFEVQRRLHVWRPKMAYVMGAGQIGLLSTLVLRLRGLEVYTLARGEAAVAQVRDRRGARAPITSARNKRRSASWPAKVGKADLIIDATGSSAVAFGCMQVLGHNGVLVWTSVTGGLAARRSALGQGESRLGAGQQAAAGIGQCQSRAFRDGHQGPGPGRSHVSRRDCSGFSRRPFAGWTTISR